MRPTLCKRLSFILVNLIFCVSLIQAQDTAKTVVPPTKPAKKWSPKPSAQKAAVKQARNKAIQQPIQTPTRVDTTPTLPVAAQPVDNSLKGQYNDLLRYSWMQKGYKVVNNAKLNSLWRNVNDTLAVTRKELSAMRQQVQDLSKKLADAKNQPVPAATGAVKAPIAAEQIELLGVRLDTETYNWIVWGTILVLGLALTTVLFTTTKSSVDARHHKQLYEEISSEYQTFKAKSKEKELKLARELQTERNTIEELLARQKEEEEPVKEVKPRRGKLNS